MASQKENKKNVSDSFENQKAIRLNDSYGTIIYINKKENPEKAIKKYLKDLEDYHALNTTKFIKGNSKLFQ